jgi:SNF2 family DNA or RNA helicase
MTFELYDFQKEDVAKLVSQRSALIGSEMGTGKTHEAIALDQLWWPETKLPTLIVTPLNTISSPWIEKYEQQAPDVDVYPIDRKNRDRFVQALRRGSADVFLMHWDALRMLVPEFNKAGIRFGTVIADEVHRASNRKAQATRHLYNIATTHKLGLSGTASGDKPWNLWSILHWLYPRTYTSYWSFTKTYAVQDEKEVWKKNADGEAEMSTYRTFVGIQNVEHLHRQMSPFYVRHLKREQCCPHHPEGVMWWLPDKVYDRIWVDLNPTQRRIYNQMREEMVAWVGEHEDSPLVAPIIVAQLTRLSQMALATPELETIMVRKRKQTPEGVVYVEEPKVNVKLTEPSSKIDAVKEYIKDEEGRQFLVYSSSKQACYLLHQSLGRADISSEVLSGDTVDSKRQDMVTRFRAGHFQVFIAVIQAGAEGIDGLQYATDTAIYLDRTWSTIKNKQSEDRLHRGGTKDTVHIVDVMARDTVDFGRHTRLEQKWEFIKMILGDKNIQKKMEAEEL